MKNKPGKKMLGPTLQLIELVPITDPAELEAIDRRRKEAEKAMKAAEKAHAAALRKAASANPPNASERSPTDTGCAHALQTELPCLRLLEACRRTALLIPGQPRNRLGPAVCWSGRPTLFWTGQGSQAGRTSTRREPNPRPLRCGRGFVGPSRPGRTRTTLPRPPRPGQPRPRLGLGCWTAPLAPPVWMSRATTPAKRSSPTTCLAADFSPLLLTMAREKTAARVGNALRGVPRASGTPSVAFRWRAERHGGRSLQAAVLRSIEERENAMNSKHSQAPSCRRTSSPTLRPSWNT